MKCKVLFCFVLLLHPFLLGSTQQSDILVYFLALPDGEATLISDENNQFSLINTGSSKSRVFLADKLEKLAVTELNYLIITDQDSSYRENKDWLIENYHVKHVYDVKGANDEHTGTLLAEGTTIPISDLLLMQTLSTDTQVSSTTNMLTYYNHAILLLGRSHLTSSQLERVKNYRAEIIKTAHFGIDFRPDPLFWDEVNPHAAIFFAVNNDLPDPFFMTYLNENWIDVYRLSEVGSINIRFSDFEYDLDV